MTTIPQPKAPTSSYTLKYDAWNRLVEVKDGTVVQANEYDGLNRRIVRDESGGSGVLKHFYYSNQWQVLVEADSSNVATAMYSYHPHYVDAVAVRMRDVDAHIYLQDANFNVTAMMDSAGTVVERYAYTPYGEVTVLDADFSVDHNGSDNGNEYLYTGRRLDPETGLQLNRNRFYHAPLGRWVNRDPSGYIDGYNLYEYVQSSPMTSVDPSGLAPKWWHCWKCVWKLNKIDIDEECNRRKMQEKCLECLDTAAKCLEEVNKKTKECVQKIADAIPDCVKCAYKVK